jgi:hypothetical protein
MGADTEETTVIDDASVSAGNPLEFVRAAIECGAAKFVIVYENVDGSVHVTPFGDPTRCDLAFYALILQQEAMKGF